jgi:hypothetical protein
MGTFYLTLYSTDVSLSPPNRLLHFAFLRLARVFVCVVAWVCARESLATLYPNVNT